MNNQLSSLSPREQQIANLTASGMNDMQIGAALGISRYTVQSYLQRIYNKMNIHNMAGYNRRVSLAVEYVRCCSKSSLP